MREALTMSDLLVVVESCEEISTTNVLCMYVCKHIALIQCKNRVSYEGIHPLLLEELRSRYDRYYVCSTSQNRCS